MEVKSFLDARFLVPPTLTFFFLFLLDGGIKLTSYIQPIDSDFIGFLTGAIFIFSLGFLISSITTAFIINLFKLRDVLSSDSIQKLQGLFPFLNRCLKIDREVATWLTIFNKEDEYLQVQLHKRWHAFNANLNSAIALLLAYILGVVIWEIQPTLLWFLLWFIGLISFIFNAFLSHQDVKNIDNIMINRKIFNTYNH